MTQSYSMDRGRIPTGLPNDLPHGYVPHMGHGLYPMPPMDPMEAGIAPMFSGIHIGEPVVRPAAFMPQHGMEQLDIKSEVDCGGVPYGMDPCYGASGQSLDPCYGASGPGLSMCSSPTSLTPGRQRKNKEDKICGVCGDRALGYNFDAISCESCKAFFRRNAPKGLEYFKCPYDEKCKMDISNRRFCKRCRLRKCFEIGMRKEYILTEEEKARKRAKIEENRVTRDVDKVMPGVMPPVVGMGMQQQQTQQQTQQPQQHQEMQPPPQHTPPYMKSDTPSPGMRDGMHTPDSRSPRLSDKEDCELTVPLSMATAALSMGYSDVSQHSLSLSPTPPCATVPLSVEDSDLIQEVRVAYSGSLDISVEKELPRDSAHSMADLVNIAEISVRRVIDMAKKIKKFKALAQTDQISLLKGGSIELLILRSVITFDKEKQHFLDPCDPEETSAMNLDQLRKAEGSELFEDHMKFVHSLAVDMQSDQTMLILLLVISLFSPDRPNLQHKETVTAEQERYSLLLKKYLDATYNQQYASTVFPKLLMKLTDIRNLNEEHSQVLLKVNPESIQPLMQEVLDLRA